VVTRNVRSFGFE